ncbi:MAG: hypothetical protein EHM70_07390 [Chloroflexota bacterium]|nr:MAG: hypothetical protein EHM70_07390 [Chloroflexota bacterium]
MYTGQEILFAVRQLRPYMEKMSEEISPEMVSEIDRLLACADAGEKVENLLMDVCAGHALLRSWLAVALDVDSGGLRSYGRLPGNTSQIAAVKYACPHKGCSFEWPVSKAGQPVPPCPVHLIPLELQSKPVPSNKEEKR